MNADALLPFPPALLPLALGAGIGLLTGLGVGGGKLLIPALVLLGVEQHHAQGITLATFLPTALVATRVHLRQGTVNLPLAVVLATGSVGGALAGAWAAIALPHELLRRLYGYFLLGRGGLRVVQRSRAAAAGAGERRGRRRTRREQGVTAWAELAAKGPWPRPLWRYRWPACNWAWTSPTTPGRSGSAARS